MKKKTLVISGINLYSGGTLSIYKDFLSSIIENHYCDLYDVIAFVYKKELFEEYKKYIKLVELPLSRKNYIFRLYYEYIYFYFYSKNKSIDVWFSIHDMTPNVIAKKRYVYCHNPTPFLKKSKIIKKMNSTVYYMSLFYKYIYKINIKKNTNVIVQQEWIRKEFQKMYNLNNIIVAQPNFNVEQIQMNDLLLKDKKIFIYSAFPRPFKNFEIIGKACKALQKYNDKFEVWLTIDGTENKYSKYIRDSFKDVKSIKWLGLIEREMMMRKYYESDYLIFPSVLETWGLPISEYKSTGKPILLAELPYAHETVGDYDKTVFFDPYDYRNLAKKMLYIINDNEKRIIRKHHPIVIPEPYTKSWNELLSMILN
ncbi:Glycosyltransferase involved in cell wall bisynthesis [Ruminococcus sp. YE71]|uniref:glycosyltransferase n=1 Tax=unclassified Ruminococcus TaxID=2608920 RepID=UPI000882AEF0|nr:MULTISPECIES: glycosyltransferase [unclassified Ruminococcus]SDA30809.1 Glycosyltransferase involved in cell wall bisynthesis [Ruminococcus sp. YE78]SFW50505.1 Glycosyltransferase involved in cell wall bisynthesis [Ruminococcus sp. YE71]